MIVNALSDVEDGANFSFDLCIVGSGPAGLALALELAPLGIRIGVLEAGGTKFSNASQDYFAGEVAGTNANEHLHSFRYRRLGGTSTAWGGRCLLYDPIDFEKRDYIPNSGWPIDYDSLLPFYDRALEWCEAGPRDYKAASVLPNKAPQMVANLPDGDIISSTLERWSPPTDFGKRYRATLQRSKTLTVLLNAACVSVNVDRNQEKIESVTVRAGAEKSFTVAAQVFVLATGGIEVPRLLLSSNSQVPAGIGNDHDLVGRYFMTHIAGLVGVAHLDVDPGTISSQYDRAANGVYVRRRMAFSEETQRRERLPNVSLQFHHPSADDPKHRTAALSLIFMVKNIGSIRRGIPPGLGIGDDEAPDTVGLWMRHLRNLVIDLPGLIRDVPPFAYRRFLQRRRIPSFAPAPKSTALPLHYHAEQSPHRDSRVTLSNERDAYGIPRAKLDFRVHDSDIEGIERIHTTLDDYLRRHNIGHVRFREEDPKAHIRRSTRAVNGHFIGTTRMADRPENGVVDPDCKVFGLSNLYISSASVFPTSSHANPTLTIIALAIRLADHLRKARWNG